MRESTAAVTYACGHTGEMKLHYVNPRAEAHLIEDAGIVARLTDCPDCEPKEKRIPVNTQNNNGREPDDTPYFRGFVKGYRDGYSDGRQLAQDSPTLPVLPSWNLTSAQPTPRPPKAHYATTAALLLIAGSAVLVLLLSVLK